MGVSRKQGTPKFAKNKYFLPPDTYTYVIQGFSPPRLNELFMPRQCSYDLRGNKCLERRRVKDTLRENALTKKIKRIRGSYT